MTALDVEFAVASFFGTRTSLIIPNVSWGLGLRYEADLVVVRNSGWAEEVEIKVSASDIVADTKKQFQHDSKWFKKLWFAVPENLKDHPSIPARAGILIVGCNDSYGTKIPWSVAKSYRAPHCNPDAKKMPPEKINDLMRLGCLRIWALKKALQNTRRNHAANLLAVQDQRE